MSRHRDVRCMNYSDEYDGYDDVYGHSVEDDYCVSPSAEQFLFDRSKQQNIASFITEPDIVEDNEDVDESLKEEKTQLTDVETAKLKYCIDTIKNVVEETVPPSVLQEIIIQSNFDPQVALDKILSQSSPKNKNASSMVKDSCEHPTGATITKPQSSFTIPKLSFKKQQNIGDKKAMNTSLINNLDTLRCLGANVPSKQFSSLSEMINNHTKLGSTSLSMLQIESDRTDTPFNSLANFTAQHLDQSNSKIGRLISSEKNQSTGSSFTIPKFSVKKNLCDNISNSRVTATSSENQIIAISNLSGIENKIGPVELLQHNLSNNLVLSESSGNEKIHLSHLQKAPEISTNLIHSVRPPSPNDLMIDLSTALKEAVLLSSNNSKRSNSAVNSQQSKSHTKLKSADSVNVPYIRLPTTLNSIRLGNVKLPLSTCRVSAFGKTLCRTWKLKKPLIKSEEQTSLAIKRFDFSTPYRRA